MPLINCQTNLILTRPANCVISNAKRYVLIVTLSTQHNAKLPQQLKSELKRTVNWDKYNSKKKYTTEFSKSIFRLLN